MKNHSCKEVVHYFLRNSLLSLRTHKGRKINKSCFFIERSMDIDKQRCEDKLPSQIRA